MNILMPVIFIVMVFSGAARAGWIVDSDGTGYVENHDGNTDRAIAEIAKTASEEKVVIFRVKPVSYEACEPQGVQNSNRGYIVKTKMFVNDTLIFAKKFIEPTGAERCLIYYVGENSVDKRVIFDAFMSGERVIIEIDGAERNVATKFRGKQVVMAGASSLDGNPITLQTALDSRGTRYNFATVPSSQVRWAIFSTEGFRDLWDQN